MDCRTFTDQLDDLLDARLDERRAGDCQAHADACDACRARLESASKLRRQLRDLSVPAPSAGFAGRVFAAVRDAHRPMFGPLHFGYALAASLAAGVSIGLAVWIGEAPEPPVPDVRAVSLAFNEVEPVRLVFRSPRALSGVTIHLQLPDGVELAGHAGRHELSWQTDLQAGANALELPVIVRHGAGGVVTASLSYGQDRRQFAVLVQARRPSALFLERPTERTAAVQGLFSARTEVDHA